MDCTITPRNANRFCRICLTSSKNLLGLESRVTEKVLNLQEDASIHLMLELVTGNKIELNDHLPSKICHMCLSFLKIAFEFQMQFKNSEELLKTIIKVPTEEPEVPQQDKSDSDIIEEEKPSVAVELIYGDKKFDLKDVVIIEEENKENFCYQGFLRNLGTEVTARFIGGEESPRIATADQVQYDVSLEPHNETLITNEQLHFDSLDLSRLTVTKYPEECEIVIEEVAGTTTTKIKSLYECPTCGKLFSERNNLEEHQKEQHGSGRIFVCEKCGHQAKTRSQLYHHLLMHGEKNYQCHLCDKKYNTSSRLKQHLEGHQNEKRHLCNQCGKTFNYYTSLKYHLEVHLGRKLTCNICGLKYTRPNTLQRHLRTHTKDKPYPCDYCPKRFPSKGEKVCHERTHTGEKPYRCKYCNKSFAKSFNLQVHCLSHPGPEECHLCPKTFVNVKFLKLHIKGAHSDYEFIEEAEN